MASCSGNCVGCSLSTPRFTLYTKMPLESLAKPTLSDKFTPCNLLFDLFNFQAISLTLFFKHMIRVLQPIAGFIHLTSALFFFRSHVSIPIANRHTSLIAESHLPTYNFSWIVERIKHKPGREPFCVWHQTAIGTGDNTTGMLDAEDYDPHVGENTLMFNHCNELSGFASHVAAEALSAAGDVA